jgi:hypothetical protein
LQPHGTVEFDLLECAKQSLLREIALIQRLDQIVPAFAAQIRTRGAYGK